jgi:hypothetical protein
MRVIRDTDTVEFVDESGDKLVLLEAPRQRDVMAVVEIEREDAFTQIEGLKRMGFDVDALMKQAKDADKTDEKAETSAKVHIARLRALAVALYLNGDRLGGDAIVKSYGDMDPASVAWVDAKVAEVWDAATPDDASARGKDADAGVSPRTSVVATA